MAAEDNIQKDRSICDLLLSPSHCTSYCTIEQGKHLTNYCSYWC